MTNEQLSSLRRMVGEPSDDGGYTDTLLTSFYVAAGNDLNLAASAVWTDKASQYAELVNRSRSGDSDSLGQLHQQALTMADRYSKLGGGIEDTGRTTKFRPIVRP